MKMKLNLARALLVFLMAYIVVSVLATGLSVWYEIHYQTPPPPPGVTVLKSIAFVATVPYHVLIMLIFWPFFAWIYFKKRKQITSAERRTETGQLSLLWLIAAITVDCVGYVLIRHPYSLTAYEFYIIYQPWISMIYGAIFLGPWIYRMLSHLLRKKPASLHSTPS